jgi:hypothetical protein
MSRAPESRANPHHAGPLTPPGNYPRRCSANQHCVAIPALCGYCAGRPVSFLVTSGPVRPSPPLCHLPGTAASSPALWESRSTGRHHAHRCAAPGLPSAQPSNQRTDDDKSRAPALLPSKPPLDGHKARHDTRQRQDLPGQLSIPRHGALFRHM